MDSYQVFGSRSSPVPFVSFTPVPDCSGSSINSKGQFNMLTVESRVRCEIAGPAIFGANAFGVIESDVLGTKL